ncbi:hypothetical protein TGAM01_v202333 [Trichoderma gamsii]|uniref:Uncharacterized protein n=1 Tax=Trichoderma gamsii TaxID=398673 RepID=A0A2P4ZY54_9HYPO|nr:hypothetical protein TGAM01_v202333 [Trichoderma gamsii]PON29225.1 hypothetical protein TGAM01_v202333 [Trichoderma gamsii]
MGRPGWQMDGWTAAIRQCSRIIQYVTHLEPNQGRDRGRQKVSWSRCWKCFIVPNHLQVCTTHDLTRLRIDFSSAWRLLPWFRQYSTRMPLRNLGPAITQSRCFQDRE